MEEKGVGAHGCSHGLATLFLLQLHALSLFFHGLCFLHSLDVGRGRNTVVRNPIIVLANDILLVYLDKNWVTILSQ